MHLPRSWMVARALAAGLALAPAPGMAASDANDSTAGQPVNATPSLPAVGAATATATALAPRPAAARGTLLAGPSMQKVSLGPFDIKHIKPDMLDDLLSRASAPLRAVVGAPRCTITTYSLRYATVGGRNEPTDAGAAVITPTGKDPVCQGQRPILLYAHGTAVAKGTNMARLRGEAQLVAAMFAAQGYIVIAPNYAGYAGSSLPYHPYLNAEQQAADMIDALRAGRVALARLKQGFTPQLFIAGYSQGGFVALATQRAIEQQYSGEFSVTAVAGLSGPYALSQFADDVFRGKINAGITLYLPLIATSAQRAGAAIYAAPQELYESAYASGIETLLPGELSRSELFKRGKLPPKAVFADPGEVQPYLVRSSYREAYLQDLASFPCSSAPGEGCATQHKLRKWMQKNDLRSYAPRAPLLLCGGARDPVVPFSNATAAASYFAAQGAPARLLDLEEATQEDEFSALRRGFAQVLDGAQAEARKAGADPELALLENYHGRYAAPFCLLAARQFFTSAAH